MRNHKILNLIKDFNPKGHCYKNNPLARTFGWWWAEQCLAQSYENLDLIEGTCMKEIAESDLNEQARRIASGHEWTASNREILEWFKSHDTKRHHQLVKAYMMFPYARFS